MYKHVSVTWLIIELLTVYIFNCDCVKIRSKFYAISSVFWDTGKFSNHLHIYIHYISVYINSKLHDPDMYNVEYRVNCIFLNLSINKENADQWLLATNIPMSFEVENIKISRAVEWQYMNIATTTRTAWWQITIRIKIS